jgi:hypothetical protein
MRGQLENHNLHHKNTLRLLLLKIMEEVVEDMVEEVE